MIKKELINFSKKHSKKALATALLVILSASFAVPTTSVMAASNGSTEASTESKEKSTEKTSGDSTNNDEEKPDEEDKNQGNILEANLGRVEFWEWKRLEVVKDAFGDNLYHPVMMISGKTMSNGRHAFISSYSDRKHVFLPTYTNKVNNYSNEFPSVPGNPESTVGGYYGYYGRRDNEEHSPAYYFDAEENYYMHLSSWAYKGMSQEDFDSKRFFTTGTSMGVPWMKVANWGPDGGRTMMYITFPDKELSGGEAAAYQPDNHDYYLYVRSLVGPGGKRSEATMCATHYEMFDKSNKDVYPQDVWHLVYGSHTVYNGGIGFSGAFWFLIGYNDSYENSTAYDKFGANILNGQTDYCFFTMFRDHKEPTEDKGIEIIPQGSKSACLNRTTTDYYYNAFVGTPHLFTSINSQTVPEGKLFPMTAGTYMPAETNKNGETEVSATEGLILPKGQVLTIDGGTVSVSCKLINNGKIIVKNGGTLIVKDGGCIMPYTKMCEGEGTIECNGGNVIIMEGGSLYGFNTGVTIRSNPYSQTNAPLRLTGGSTLINYGKLSLTYGIVDNGSKIENRKNGRFNIGYNRSDPLELNPNLSSYLSKANPANYPQGNATIGLYPLTVNANGSNKTISRETAGVVKNEKTATIVGSEDCHVPITTPEY